MFKKGQAFKPPHIPDSDTNLTKAKKVPIQSLYKGGLKKTGTVLMGKCPFHDEKTPSFAIYFGNNTWTCFAGCGGGDVISFYMRVHNCEFQEAVEVLSK